ncbi:MAG: hypothetical protein M3112_09275 [Actinomycetia bacterium]|nr:hypothetical protein [Actinomycetes bacterium]
MKDEVSLMGTEQARFDVTIGWRMFGVVVLVLLALAACDGTGNTTSETIGADALSVWDEPVVVAETTTQTDPLFDVAVGPDGLPIVMFLGVTDKTVEVHRCVDPDCTEVEGSSIEIPQDWMLLGQHDIEVGPSGLPLVVESGVSLLVDENGIEVFGDPFVWLTACDDLVCNRWRETHFNGERGPAVAFTPDGTMVLATTVIVDEDEDPRDFETFLLIRTCADTLCEEELSKTTISVPRAFQAKSLLLDPDGVPTVVFGLPAGGDPAGGAGTVAAYVCVDQVCSDAEPVLVAEVDNDNDEGWWFPHAAEQNGQVALAIGGEVLGVTMLLWDDPAQARSIQIDPLDGDADAVWLRYGTAVGTDGLPVVVYRRTTDAGTESEVNSLMFAKCDDAACTSGTRSVLMREGDGTFVYYPPRITVDLNGLPIIVYGTYPQGFKTAHVNIIRCTDPACVNQSKDEIEYWSSAP